MEITYIYSISDVKNNEVFYVGRTINPKTRFNNHCNGYEVTTKKIQKMIKEGNKPVFSLLEECNRLNQSERERFWIDKFFKDGHPLMNYTKKKRELPYGIKISEGVSFDEETLYTVK